MHRGGWVQSSTTDKPQTFLRWVLWPFSKCSAVCGCYLENCRAEVSSIDTETLADPAILNMAFVKSRPWACVAPPWNLAEDNGVTETFLCSISAVTWDRCQHLFHTTVAMIKLGKWQPTVIHTEDAMAPPSSPRPPPSSIFLRNTHSLSREKKEIYYVHSLIFLSWRLAGFWEKKTFPSLSCTL